jgi:hypothetical protein
MALWFATIALLGIWARHPSVLAAIRGGSSQLVD